VLTAIARHHSASTHSFGDYELHSGSAEAVGEALKLTDMEAGDAALIMESPSIRLEDYLIEGQNFRQLLLYLWVVRVLRLCDGMSQE